MDRTRPAKARWIALGMLLLWGLLLSAVLVGPYWLHSPTLGDDLTRHMVRLALAFYAVAVTLMLCLRPADWQATTGRGQVARWCWTLALAAYLVHLAMAFHFYHHWSHADAVAHTQEVSGFGPGIWFSHLFTLVWTLDVASWWLRPARNARRSPWWDRLLHAYLAFIVFNATVVYEQGPIRWAGLLLFTELGLVLGYRWLILARRATNVSKGEQTSVPNSL